VVEAGLGYFINPLVNVVLGVLVLHERLNRAQRIAVALASAGVAVLTVAHGRPPWIALALAVTVGLWETGLMAPLAAGYLVVLGQRGTGAFGASHPGTSALLALGRAEMMATLSPGETPRARSPIAARQESRVASGRCRP
jgi:chloramphenicol-sensitive protein RarD